MIVLMNNQKESWYFSVKRENSSGPPHAGWRSLVSVLTTLETDPAPAVRWIMSFTAWMQQGIVGKLLLSFFCFRCPLQVKQEIFQMQISTFMYTDGQSLQDVPYLRTFISFIIMHYCLFQQEKCCHLNAFLFNSLPSLGGTDTRNMWTWKTFIIERNILCDFLQKTVRDSRSADARQRPGAAGL